MANILVITRGTRGDIVIFIALAKALHNQGHSVTFLTHSFYSQLAKDSNLDFIALDTEEKFNQFIEDGYLLNSPSGITTFFEKHILNSVLSDYEIIKSKFIPNQTLIVARYMSEIGAIFASEKLNIPIVCLFPHVGSVMTMPILAEICANNLADHINNLRKQIQLPEVLDWTTWVKYSHSNILSWPEWLAIPDKTWPIEITPVGFLLDDSAEGGEIPEKLENILSNEKPILISAGTGKFLGENFYSSSVEACKKLGQPAILVTPYDEFVPSNLASNIYHFKYLPFAKLMTRVKAVIHHGGTSTSARAILAGIPQLILAVGAERPDTAIRLEKLGVAKFLSPPYWQEEKMAQALENLLSSQNVADRCRELSNKLQKANSLANACKIIEITLLKHQNNSVNLIANRNRQISQLSTDKKALLALLLSKKQANAVDKNASNVLVNTNENKPINTTETLILENIIILSSFTSQPIKMVLDFWINKLNLSAKVEFAPYNQILQEFMDKNSLTLSNKKGVNILLFRIEDLYQSSQGYSLNALTNSLVVNTIENNLQNLLEALVITVKESIIPYIVLLCPSSPNNINNPLIMSFLNRMQALVLEQLKDISNLYLITPQEINNYYPVKDYYDEQANKTGHIPYTPSFFTALATILARRIYRIKNKARKVIVLDCDNTLWQGVCGEDGSLGVTIDTPRKELQRFILSQYSQGMLICLCSKNNEEDVLEVFNNNPEMLLKLEHITAYRINWKHKSENLSSLAEELKLGLDSFIFIDDDALECAQVESIYPQILTLLIPKAINKISNFLNHIWDFDHLNLTDEDKRRSIFYKESQAREIFSKQSKNLQDFLEKLDLQINIDIIKPEQINRAAQLTQRTNQFNFTAIIKNENEIKQISQKEYFQILAIEAKDRFGDYGLVGLIIFELGKEALKLETFLLSCRALGRGIEYKMVAKLGEIAILNKLSFVDIFYKDTGRNKPAKNFIFNHFYHYRNNLHTQMCFRVPTDFISSLTYNTIEKNTETLETQSELPKVEKLENLSVKSSLLLEIASNLSTVEEISLLIQTQKNLRPNIATKFLEPQSEIEKKVAQIWSEFLGLKEIGLNDNFFDLGGHSFLATQIASKLSKEFNFEVPILAFFEKPTIATLAALISNQNNNSKKSSKEENYLDQTIALAKRRKDRLRHKNS